MMGERNRSTKPCILQRQLLLLLLVVVSFACVAVVVVDAGVDSLVGTEGNKYPVIYYKAPGTRGQVERLSGGRMETLRASLEDLSLGQLMVNVVLNQMEEAKRNASPSSTRWRKPRGMRR